MRICHLADSHLGAGSGRYEMGKRGLNCRQEDFVDGFTQAVDRIIEIKPDICIHAGDLFHDVRPSNRIMALAAEQLYRLAREAGIPMVIIAGNHDAPKQPHFGAALEVFAGIENLYPVCAGKLELIRIGEMAIHALPHCLTVPILKEELARCRPDQSARFNILVAHGVAAGMPEFSMADLGEQEIPLEDMARFDYTALGHFHNYTKVGPRALYSGSTERLSQTERDAPKGFVEVNLDPFDIRFHEVRTRRMVDIPVINAAGKRGDQLAAIIKDKIDSLDSSDKIVRIKVEGVSEETLKTIPSDVIRELKQKSFALNLSFEKEKSDSTDPAFGRTGIGRLDLGFIEFLETTDLKGFDRERLKQEAMKYLANE